MKRKIIPERYGYKTYGEGGNMKNNCKKSCLNCKDQDCITKYETGDVSDMDDENYESGRLHETKTNIRTM